LNGLAITSPQSRASDAVQTLCWTSTQTRLLRERAEGVGPPPLVAAIELDGPVDGDRLDRAWQDVQRRQPFLRLRIGADGPIAAADVRALIRADLPGSSPSFQTDTAQIVGTAARPRDLASEAPTDAVLIRTGPEAYLLVCSIDHLATDGWSFGLIAREWSALYQSQGLPEAPDPNAVVDSLADPKRVRASMAACERLAQEFAGAQPFPLPHSTGGWAFQQVDLPLDVARTLRARALKERSTPFALALGAFARALAIEHGTRDLIVSTHVANRSVPQSERIVCAMYNSVPLRVAAPDADGLDGWVAAAKRAALRALDRQSLPFAVARDTLSAALPPDALLRVMINVDEHPFLGFVLPGVEVHEAAAWGQQRVGPGIHAPYLSTSSRPWPAGITMSFRETWDCLQLYVHYGSALGDRAATMLLGRVTENLALLTD
jgi:hypothetical protein